MRKLAFLALLGLIVACGDDTISPTFSPGPIAPAISDASQGEGHNPGFWWLPPMVSNPKLTGTFQGRFHPSVIVVCHSNTAGDPSCDGELSDSRVAAFSVGSGLLVGSNHFQADLKTQDLGMVPTIAGDTTTYRILAFTDELAAFGGPFLLGFADFQLAETGKEAKNLANPTELIALVGGQTLPIRFHVNETAYPHALGQFAEQAPEEQETFCEINCSVTIVSATDTTEASLPRTDGAGSGEVVSLLFEPGDLDSDAVLVLDERVEDGEAANCAPGINLHKLNCVRGVIRGTTGTETPIEFNKPVRFGLSRCNVPLGEGTHYVIKKYDRVDGEDRLEEPVQDVDVSDFFDDDCDALGLSFSGSVNRLARAVLDFFVPPAFAGDSVRAGGTIRSLSDLFWALDANASAVTADGEVDAGTAVPMTVKVENHHQEPREGIAGQEVLFTILDGGGTLAVAGGTAGAGPVSVTTLADGTATVNWTVAPGGNVLQAETPTALGGPITFSVTGLGMISRWSGDSTAVDAAGENDAIWEGGALQTYAEGVIEEAFAFNGDPRIVRAGAEDWGESPAFTVAAWVYMDPNGSATALQRLVTAVGPEGLRAYLYQDGVGEDAARDLALRMGFPSLGTEGAEVELRSPVPLAAGCWQHVAATYDASTMRLFMNGIEVAFQNVGAPLAAATNLWLSHDFVDESGAAPASLHGRIDDLRVYNKALTVEDLGALPGMPAEGCEADLALASPFAFTPGTLEAGDQVTIAPWSVTNSGAAVPAGTGVNAGVYLSTDAIITTADVGLGGYLITENGFATGQVIERAAAQFVIPASTPPGDYFLGLLLDHQGIVPESDETNNAASAPLTVSGPIGVWSSAGTLVAARRDPAVMLLQSGPDAGKVLIVGGSASGAELYDPATDGTTQLTGERAPLVSHGQWPTATQLLDGTILFAGGSAGGAQLYDPETGQFSATAGPMHRVRLAGAASRLPDGRVLITGGGDEATTHADAEIYDPTTGEFTLLTAPMVAARRGHASTVLADGRVLIVGWSSSPAEVFNPATGTFTATGTLPRSGRVWWAGGAYSLTDGSVIVITSDGIEVYDPEAGTFAAGPALGIARGSGASVRLPDGRIVLTGGVVTGAVTQDMVEIYDPATGQLLLAGSLAQERQQHGAVVLADGSALVLGGFSFALESDTPTIEQLDLTP